VCGLDGLLGAVDDGRERRPTPSGKPSFEIECDEAGRSHADRFWSVRLACWKERGPMPGSMPEIGGKVIGRTH
jgi:hypothetical protein